VWRKRGQGGIGLKGGKTGETTGLGKKETKEKKLEKRSRTDKREREPNETKRKDWRKTGNSEPRGKAGHAKKKIKKTEEE